MYETKGEALDMERLNDEAAYVEKLVQEDEDAYYKDLIQSQQDLLEGEAGGYEEYRWRTGFDAEPEMRSWADLREADRAQAELRAEAGPVAYDSRYSGGIDMTDPNDGPEKYMIGRGGRPKEKLVPWVAATYYGEIVADD
jgi:hypothetical protein